MRTTIELPDDQRARLLEIAARRGEKGFSHLVQEAVARFLEEERRREERAQEAVAVLGEMSEDDAEALEESFRRLRRRWR